MFYHFLYPTPTPAHALPAFSPLPIVGLLELRLLPPVSIPAQVVERQSGEPEASKTKEAWKGGVRQLSLLAGRSRVPSADAGLHETVQ